MDSSQSQCPGEDANPAYRRITGYRVQEALGKPLNLFEGPATDAAGVAELRAAIGKVTPAAMLLQAYRKDGTPFWNDTIVSPVSNGRGVIIHRVVQMRARSERKNLESPLAQALKQEAEGQAGRGAAGGGRG